ncbi:MAG: dockerin type I domain-containing protein [Porcipelethomonas sp.]
MSTAKKIVSIAAAAACMLGVCELDKYALEVNAANNLIFDYSQIGSDPMSQFYYSDEQEFYIDGIKVFYNDEEVTDDVDFIFYTTPASTYDGKNHDYVVPFVAEYEGKAAEGQLDVKIGLRGDANGDNKITPNDLVLIQNDLLQDFYVGKSALTAEDGLGIFLSNADGRQTNVNRSPFGRNKLNIGDAFFVSSFLNGKGNGSMYDNILLNNAIKAADGEITISSVKGKAGEIVTVPVSQKSHNCMGAFDITCKWSNPDLELIGVVSSSPDISVFSALRDGALRLWGYGNKHSVSDGEMLYLQFRIPQDASAGTKYDITVYSVDYFGAGYDVSDQVLTYDGDITVALGGTHSDSRTVVPVEDRSGISYDCGIRVWDAVVEYGTTQTEVPVILLGGIESKGLSMTVQCDAPLSIKSLENAASSGGTSSEGILGIYDSAESMRVDFETLEVSIASDAAPGTYPISITLGEFDGTDEDSEIAVFNGSVTIKDKYFIYGDANADGNLDVRDAAYISRCLAEGRGTELPQAADYNRDGAVNVRDAAAIAQYLAGSVN